MTRTITHDHDLFDAVKEHLDIHEDGLLAKALKVQPSCISKIRNGTNKVSASIILKIHLLTRVPVEELLEYCPQQHDHLITEKTHDKRRILGRGNDLGR